jgi:CelD/BcsL family acetyltransferase involved in cellulose biosynthesis
MIAADGQASTARPARAVAAPIRWRRLAAAHLGRDPELAREWDRLNASRCDLAFLAADTIAAAIDVFGTGREQILIGSVGPNVVAMLVLAPVGGLRWQTFQPSQIPLGAWVAAPDLHLLALASSLMRGPLGACLALSITQVDPLIESRADDTASTRHSDYIDTCWIDVEGSFADYWAARGKNLRQNLRKQRNKLAAEGVKTHMRMLHEPHEMAPALARYGVLESSGWKAAEGTSIHQDNAQGRFYRQLFEAAAARGEALVCEYLFDDRTVAMNLCLLRKGTLVVLKTTYDESIKLFSPASLLREEELREFFAKGRIRRIEYYGRMMDWHAKLTDRKRTLHHLTAYRWPLLKKLTEWRRTSKGGGAAAPSTAPDEPVSG